jgi:hypothetical protein
LLSFFTAGVGSVKGERCGGSWSETILVIPSN